MEADMYTDDYTDEISELVEEAHEIFNATFMSLSVPEKDGN